MSQTQNRQSQQYFNYQPIFSNLATQIVLRPQPPKIALDVEIRSKTNGNDELVKVEISNCLEESYTFHDTDLTICLPEARVFPPISQQHAGLVIPQKGKGSKTVTLNWNEYVLHGVWTREDKSHIWGGNPKDKTNIKVHAGTTTSWIANVSTPEIILKKQAATKSIEYTR